MFSSSITAALTPVIYIFIYIRILDFLTFYSIYNYARCFFFIYYIFGKNKKLYKKKLVLHCSFLDIFVFGFCNTFIRMFFREG